MNGHRFIEEQNLEEKEALRKKTEQKLGFSFTHDASSEKRTNSVGKYCTLFATVTCVICLLIALPFIFKKAPTATDGTRYCQEKDYTQVWSDITIKEYNAKVGGNLLFLDIYENTEEVSTSIYVSKIDETDIIFFKEILYLQDTLDEIELYITDTRTQVDILTGLASSCVNTTSLNDILIQWTCEKDSGIVLFSYKGYRYLVIFNYSIEEENMFRMIEDML